MAVDRYYNRLCVLKTDYVYCIHDVIVEFCVPSVGTFLVIIAVTTSDDEIYFRLWNKYK